MRTFVVELVAEHIEASLLSAETAGRGAGGLRFQRAMHPLVPAILSRAPRLDELGQDPQAYPPRRELRQPAHVVVAKGTPLSVRIRFGNPYSWKRRVKTGLAPATAVELSA